MEDQEQDSFVDLIRGYIKPGTVESLIRTYVPVGVGLVLAWVATNWNIVVPENASSAVVTLVVGAFVAGYYTLGRLVERRWPKLGRLLLALNLTKARPLYSTPEAADAVEADARQVRAAHRAAG